VTPVTLSRSACISASDAAVADALPQFLDVLGRLRHLRVARVPPGPRPQQAPRRPHPGLPGADDSWQTGLPPMLPRTLPGRIIADLRWAYAYLIPRLIRHARGHSSGDGRTAKRPALSSIHP
jgi:hypothetical protein